MAQNFNIYKRLFLDLISLPDNDRPECYRMLANLRDFLLQLVRVFSTFRCVEGRSYEPDLPFVSGEERVHVSPSQQSSA